MGSISQKTSRPHGPRVVHHWQRVRARPARRSTSALWKRARCSRRCRADVECRGTPQGEAYQQRREAAQNELRGAHNLGPLPNDMAAGAPNAHMRGKRVM